MTWRAVVGSCIILIVATLCGLLLMLAHQGEIETIKNIIGGVALFSILPTFVFGIPWAMNKWG